MTVGDVIATGHQPNLLYPISVTEKIRAADVFIVCDRFQMVRHGWVNRQQLADGTPLVVPYDNRDRYAPIQTVRIADATFRARTKLAKTLELRFGREFAEAFTIELHRPFRRLAALNIALNRILLGRLEIDTAEVRQSDLEAGIGSGPLVTDDRDDMPTISEQLAEMTAEVGANVWLSGPSGRSYLDETPFLDRGLRVEYFGWPADSPNPSAIELLRKGTR
ncbi:MAG TPA: WbqC family protein [Gaiellaceae bacterium]|jgi:hypothetical protein|nr:WbqC family protein [Gaiellaceae bacterium]